MPPRRKARKVQVVLDNGLEPQFSEDDEVSRSDLMSAFSWYSEQKAAKDAQKYLVAWLKSKRKHKVAKEIQSLAATEIPTTLGWYARLYTRGLDESVGKDYVQKKLEMLLKKAKKSTNPKTKVSRPSVQEHIKERINEVIGEVEEEVDQFLLNNCKHVFSLSEWLREKKLKSMYAKRIADFYEPQLNELLAIDKDKEIREGYSSYTKTQIKAMTGFFEKLVKDARNWEVQTKTRRTRKVKRSVADLVRGVKYCKECAEHGIKSIRPTQIIGASEIWVYDTRNRRLGVYRASDANGFSITGTTLHNVKEVLFKTIRKPQETLPRVLRGKKRACKKVFTELTTKEQSGSSRLNKNMVILKAL